MHVVSIWGVPKNMNFYMEENYLQYTSESCPDPPQEKLGLNPFSHKGGWIPPPPRPHPTAWGKFKLCLVQYILGPKNLCKTVSGPDVGAYCVFPFMRYSTTYDGCSKDWIAGDPAAWCSTNTWSYDPYEFHEIGLWGRCSCHCPIHGGDSEG